MKIGSRETLLVLAVILFVAVFLIPNLALPILGAIQSVSIIILAWVAIAYLLKLM